MSKPAVGPRLSDRQRLSWLRLIHTPNVGPAGIMAQTLRVRRNWNQSHRGRNLADSLADGMVSAMTY
ncbi:hypothetical protein D3227_20665 [Mesorhizobium waimense]|uniref:Uncharacterized protein n=1 Tax=Mesorhizobium waimense TaxID=1300307 RepID=A0A3A5KTX4_9HYPH|nr:hypothetical protein D3227_20665 [Mesorhizobium waimense]